MSDWWNWYNSDYDNDDNNSLPTEDIIVDVVLSDDEENITTGLGNDTVNVTGSGEELDINTYAGDDSVNVDATLSEDLTVNLGDGNDELNVTGNYDDIDIDAGDADSLDRVNVNANADDLRIDMGTGAADVYVRGTYDDVTITNESSTEETTSRIDLNGTFDDVRIVTGNQNENISVGLGTIDGATGDDLYINAGDGDNLVSVDWESMGNYGSDATIITGSGNDRILVFGLADDLLISTGSGDDQIIVQWEGDGTTYGNLVTVFAGSGDDLVRLNDGNLVDFRFIDGGYGVDTVAYFDTDVGVTVDLNNSLNNAGAAANDILYRVENLLGSGGDDLLIGDDNANNIRASGGEDTIEGRGGDDTLAGDGLSANLRFGSVLTEFSDTIDGGEGNDTIAGDRQDSVGIQLDPTPFFSGAFGASYVGGDDTLTDLSGNNTIYGDTREYNLIALAGEGLDFFDFNDSNAFMEGNNFTFGNDNITTGSGSDTVYGDVGVHTVTLTAGNLVSEGFANAIIRNTNTTYGNDTITDLGGDNLIVGDAGVTNYTATAGSDDGQDLYFGEALAFFEQSTVVYGNDAITSGLGNDLIYGDVEALSITILGGNDNQGDNRSSANYLANTVFFGDDIINVTGGHNMVTGDAGDIDITLQPGSKNFGGDQLAYFEGNFWVFGSDDITTGDGNDTIHGDITNLTITMQTAQGHIDNANGDAGLIANNIIMGNDTIDAGNGDNTVYGDVNDYTLNLLVGDNTSSQDLDMFVTGSPIEMGSDTIALGTGNNTVYGDAATINYNLLYGDGVENLNFVGIYIQGRSNIRFGDDNIDGTLSASNNITGDVGTWNITLDMGTNSQNQNGFFTFSGVSSTTFFHVFGSDFIQGSTLVNSTNTIVGDFDTINQTLKGGDSAPFVERIFLNDAMAMGNDTIIVDSGHTNVVIGDGRNYNQSVTGSNNVQDNPFGNAFQSFLPFTGSDFIRVGGQLEAQGVDASTVNNTLIGDIETYTVSFTGGQNSNVFGAVSGAYNTGSPNNPGVDKMFSDDTLINEWGNAIMIGDVKTLDVTVLGANNTTSDFFSSSVEQFGGFGTGNFAFGSDYIVSNSPTDDMLYGEGINMNVSITSGSVANGNENFAGWNTINPVRFGDDTLIAGAGDDVVYGDWVSVTISLKDGKVLDFGESAAYWNSQIIYGDDTFISGAGNDTYIGDGAFSYTHVDAAGNDISFFDGAFYTQGGRDTISYEYDINGVTVDLLNETATDGWGDTDTLQQIENVRGSNYADTITGDFNENHITGLAGNDVLDGGGNYWGNRLVYESAFQGIVANLATGVVIDSWGDTDTVSNFEQLRGTFFDDVIIGSNNNEQLEGYFGNDIVDAAGGNDRLMHTSSFDIDAYDGGDDFDILDATEADALEVLMVDDTDFGDFIGVETVATNIELVIGSEGNDFIDASQLSSDLIVDLFLGGDNTVLYGDGGYLEMVGGNGNDVLVQSGGSVFMEGGQGFDTLVASFSTDNMQVSTFNVEEVTTGSGNDWVEVSYFDFQDFGPTFINLGAGNDTLYASFQDDVIVTGSGNDVVNAGGGYDVIIDFEDGADLLDVSDYGLTDINDFAGVFDFGGFDTGIDINGVDFVMLVGVNIADVDNSDFLFV